MALKPNLFILNLLAFENKDTPLKTVLQKWFIWQDFDQLLSYVITLNVA